VSIVNLDNTPLDICEVRVFTGAKPVEPKKPPPPPPPPPKVKQYGNRRRSPASSYKPKGKKMLGLEPLELQNKWSNYNLGYGSAFLKVQGYFCTLSGLITGPAFGVLAQLPDSCLPKHTLVFLVNNHYGVMKVTVNPSGEVSWAGGSQENKWVSLNGITFSTSPYHRKVKMKNGWMAFDTQKYPEANFVVENRLCVLGGLIFAGAWDVVGVLAPECRPKYLRIFNAATGPDLDKLARINIYPDGRIMWAGGQQEDAFLSLNGISFQTAPYKKPKLIKDLAFRRSLELGAEETELDSAEDL
jgi:hypothetical protein